MKNLRGLIIVAAIANAGCSATDLGQPKAAIANGDPQELQDTPSCCTTYNDVSFTALSSAKAERISVGPSGPVFEFNFSKSYFVAYQLPSTTSTVVIKSYPVGDAGERGQHILIPSIVFLNGSKSKIADYAPPFSTMTDKQSRDRWVESTIRVPQGAAYFILYDGKASIGAAFEDSGQRSGVLYIKPSSTGTLEVFAAPTP